MQDVAVLASPRFIQNLYRGFVGIDERPANELVSELVHQGLAAFRRLHHPDGHGESTELDPVTGEDLLFTIEGQSIAILGDGDKSRKRGRRKPLGDELGGWGSDHNPTPRALDSLVNFAGVLVPDVAEHLDLRWNDVELLADFFVNPAELGAAGTCLFSSGESVDHIHAGKVIGDRLSFGSSTRVLGNHQRLFRFRLCHEHFRFIENMQLLQLRFRRPLLGFAPEALFLEKPNPLLEELNPGAVLSVQIHEQDLESIG
jgi:hypothetical protein